MSPKHLYMCIKLTSISVQYQAAINEAQRVRNNIDFITLGITDGVDYEAVTGIASEPKVEYYNWLQVR